MDSEQPEPRAEPRVHFDDIDDEMVEDKSNLNENVPSTSTGEFNESSEGEKAPKAPRFKRKVGTWIFESVGGFYLPTENVAKLSLRKQEQLLIRDLIYSFSGVPSSHIRPEISTEQVSQLRTDQIDSVRFKIEESFSSAFRALANELLPLIGYYINVQSFIEDTIMATGCERTLGISLHHSMQEYFEFQAGLETQLREQNLNLHQLVIQLRPWLVSMQSLASLTSSVRGSRLNSAQLLSLMEKHHEHFKSEPLKLLLTDVSGYYMKVAQLWTQKGVLYDVRKEFFIEDTVPSDLSTTLLAPEQCCHAYWAKRYRVHMELLPSFLVPLSDRIVLAGKYLNILRQCNVRMKLLQEPLTYVPGEEAHVTLIRESYELPARKLLEVLVHEQHLLHHLDNLQGYFLLQRHDFTESLLAGSANQLQCNVDTLMPEKLRKILLTALQHSSDQHKNLLHCQLMDCDVATQLANRQKRLRAAKESDDTQADPVPEVEGDVSSDAEPSSEPMEQLLLSGYEAFALRYEPTWPISLVLHEESLEQLQLLHRVLFYLRYVRLQMKSSGSNTNTLHTRMVHCIQQLEGHMLNDIVEPRWQLLMSSVQQAQLVDEVLSQYQETLDKCQLLCLSSEPVTYVRSIFTLGQLCLNFNSLMQQPVSSKSLAQDISEYEQEFYNLLLGITDLLTELARPNGSSGGEERECCMQLLRRLEHLDSDPTSTVSMEF